MFAGVQRLRMQRYDEIIEKLQNCFEMSVRLARSGAQHSAKRVVAIINQFVRILETTAVVNIVSIDSTRMERHSTDVRCICRPVCFVCFGFYFYTLLPVSMSKLACATSDITESERHIPWMTLLRASTLQTRAWSSFVLVSVQFFVFVVVVVAV